MESLFRDMNVQTLKRELKKRRLTESGTHVELLDRLVEFSLTLQEFDDYMADDDFNLYIRSGKNEGLQIGRVVNPNTDDEEIEFIDNEFQVDSDDSDDDSEDN